MQHSVASLEAPKRKDVGARGSNDRNDARRERPPWRLAQQTDNPPPECPAAIPDSPPVAGQSLTATSSHVPLNTIREKTRCPILSPSTHSITVRETGAAATLGPHGGVPVAPDRLRQPPNSRALTLVPGRDRGTFGVLVNEATRVFLWAEPSAKGTQDRSQPSAAPAMSRPIARALPEELPAYLPHGRGRINACSLL